MENYPTEIDLPRTPSAAMLLLLYTITLILPRVVVLPLLLVWLRRRDVGLGLNAGSTRGVFRATVLGLIIASLSFGLHVVAFGVLSAFFPDRVSGWYFSDRGWLPFGPPSPRTLAIVVVSVVIAAPLIEEIVFRRCAFMQMEARWGFKRAALLSSGAFAAFHWNALALSAFVFGLIACVVYYETRNLLDPVLAHVTTNIVLVVAFAVAASGAPYTPQEISQLYKDLWVPAVVALIIGFVGVVWVLISRWPRTPREISAG